MYRKEQGPVAADVDDDAPSSDVDMEGDDKAIAVKRDDSRAGSSSTAMRNRTRADRALRQQLRQQQRNNGASKATASAASGGGSIVWPVLLIGLVLCITDVIYMMGVLERQGHRKEHHKHQHQKHHEKVRRQQEVKRHEEQVKADNADPSNYIHSEDDPQKHRILRLIREAKVTYLDKDTYDSLPRWSEVVKLYGAEPKIIGEDTCKSFQTDGEAFDHFIGTAGNFNTGTNLLAELLISNCHMQARMDKYGKENRGIRWQVPWGKHTPPGDEEFRTQHKTKKDKGVDADSVLPAVTVRDPYQWMQSMCRHQYTTKWIHADHCPNLVPTLQNRKNHTELEGKMSIPVNVKYAEFKREFESMAHFWNDWNAEYIDGVDIPRIIVRYEDLIFYPHQVVTRVCECGGGSMRKDGTFHYVTQSAKKGKNAHGPSSARTGYVDAIIKYGSAAHRFDGYTPHDLKYFHDSINKEHMKMFRYKLYPHDELVKNLNSLKRNNNHHHPKKVAVIDRKEIEEHDAMVHKEEEEDILLEKERKAMEENDAQNNANRGQDHEDDNHNNPDEEEEEAGGGGEQEEEEEEEQE